MPLRWLSLMPQANPKAMRAGLTAAMVTAGLDQTSKWAVVHFFALLPGQAQPVLPFLDITFIWNRGISYGLLATDSELGRWLLVVMTLAICGFLAWSMRHAETALAQLGYGLIIGGALGNLVDRLVYGAVVDFISLHAAGYYWYVFNLADVWISFGVVALLIDVWRTREL